MGHAESVSSTSVGSSLLRESTEIGPSGSQTDHAHPTGISHTFICVTGD